MYKGIAASPGIVIGKVFLMAEEDYCIIKRFVSDEEVDQEVERFYNALNKTREEMRANYDKVLKELGEKHADLFRAYLLILEDALLTDDVANRVKDENINVEYALQEVLKKVADTFKAIDDPYLRERERDINDVVKKIIHNLLGKKTESIERLTSPVIVVAHSLVPSDTINMKKDIVKAFITDIGGRTSHTAILAQSMEIPAVVGMHDITKHVKNDDMIIVDGYKGTVVVNPDKKTVEKYLLEKDRMETYEKTLEKLHDLPAVTTDNVNIDILGNIEISEEVSSILSHGGFGVGLYRTEYLYLDRLDLPTEEEQYEHYKFVAESMMPHPVIIRTVDLGGDKLSKQLNIFPERNPFLGLRAIRLCLKFPNLFKTQLRAILRASVYGRLKVMYPMISCLDELRRANELLDEVKDDLRDKGIPFNNDIEVGIMIEIPSAASMADMLVKECDFMSLGTNDLIQYTMAVDRDNENVSHLYKPTHLPVLRLIKNTVDACKRSGKSISMCGELASDTKIAKLLVGIGLETLSMNPISIPKMKEVIRSFSYKDAKELADKVFTSEDYDEVTRILDDLYRE